MIFLTFKAMKFMSKGGVYKKIYVIRVLNTINSNTWYYTKANMIYESEIVHIKNRPYFQIDYLHKIPAECAVIVETKTVILYKKY